MVKITDGQCTLVVTRGAFDGVYRQQGYRLVNDHATHKSDTVHTDVQKDLQKKQPSEANDDVQSDLEMKPISQWTKSEVKAYAAQFGIDLAGTKNVGEAKDRIKAFMADRQG